MNLGKNFEHVGNKIEVKKNPLQMLKIMLDRQSKEINEVMKNEYKLNGLLNPDATIDPNGYTKIYNEEEMKKHADYIHKRELDFTSANNPGVQDFFKRKFGTNNPNEIIAKWKEEKLKEKNSLMEMAVTALLFEKLGNDFFVVRTATYDDYKNGADNLIIDRKTGEVVGAFDEVHDSGGGKYTDAKEKKIISIAKKGGTDINYGLKLVDGKFVRAELKNVPVFYLGLEESEFEKLKNGLVNNNAEMKDEIFDKLIESLSAQHKLLKQYGKTDEFRTNLNSLGTFLSRIMENKELEIAM